MRSFLCVLLLVTASYYRGWSQEVYQDADCASLLSGAENDFAAGRFYGIPTLLKGCIDRNEFSREEQLRVYTLLAQVYLVIDDPAQAEESYLKLLAADPEFLATEDNAPIDIVYLSKKFTTTPVFTPHFKAGINATSESTIFEISTISKDAGVRKVYQAMPGYTLGTGIEWNINNNFGLGGEVLATYKSFLESAYGIWGTSDRIVTEKQFWVDIPFYLRYGSYRGKVRPYGYAGYSVNLLVRDRLQLLNQNLEAANTEGPDLKVLYKRHILNGSVVLGGGIKYKVGKNFVLMDLRIMAGLTNILKEEYNFYADKDTYTLATDVTRYGSTDDIHRINNYSLSFGFVRPLYDPRRLEKPRTKGVSRKLSRK